VKDSTSRSEVDKMDVGKIKVKYAVITEASLKPSREEGNWEDNIAVINLKEQKLYVGAEPSNNDPILFLEPFTITLKGKAYTINRVKTPAFVKGEILIVNAETEREIAGRQRKPSKWYVKYEVYDNVEEAVKKALEVGKE
jgi:hypothetical protein